jgi:hypothetical protein
MSNRVDPHHHGRAAERAAVERAVHLRDHDIHSGSCAFATNTGDEDSRLHGIGKIAVEGGRIVESPGQEGVPGAGLR